MADDLVTPMKQVGIEECKTPVSLEKIVFEECKSSSDGGGAAPSPPRARRPPPKTPSRAAMVRSLSGRFMEGYERKPVVNLTHGDFDLGDIAHESARGCLRNGTVRLPGEDGDGAECLVRVVSKRRQRHSCDWLVRQKAALLEFGHPFLLRLLGTFQDDRNLFGIFEPCAGGELFSWLRKGEVPWAVASFYGAEVAAALDHVHLCKLRERSRGTVLRSVAPECVWLDRLGHVKLRDFDHIGILDEDGRCATTCGLLDYAAPELLRRGDHGAPVDWWGLGVLLYEICVGEPPFFGDDAVESFKLALHANPSWTTRIAKRRVRLEGGARGLVDDLLAKDPRHRLQGGPALSGRGMAAGGDPPLVPHLEPDDEKHPWEVYPEDPDTDKLPPPPDDAPPREPDPTDVFLFY